MVDEVLKELKKASEVVDEEFFKEKLEELIKQLEDCDQKTVERILIEMQSIEKRMRESKEDLEKKIKNLISEKENRDKYKMYE